MAVIPIECSESKETTVALVSHDCRTRVGQPALLLSCTKQRHAAFFSGSIFLRAVFKFNADRVLPCCGPRCYSGLHGVRCRGSARAFAASKLYFSEKLRSAVGKVYLPEQRVRERHTCVLCMTVEE